VAGVTETLIVQGRRLGPSELEQIRQWRAVHADWSRRRLSRELAAQWGWRNEAGQLKDMAARTLLVKLEQRGLVQLPPRRRTPPNRMRCRGWAAACAPWDQRPLQCGLAELGTLRVEEVSGLAAERGWVAAALRQFHYLGFGGPVGQNLQYGVRDGSHRRLACLVFGAAAWKCQDRDRFIGWSASQRQQHLGEVANNSRFLILPWVAVPGLGSWILGQVSRRIAGDWQAKYGHRVVLLESFVERGRFRGTVYRAANWQPAGVTAGRTRQDRHTCIRAPVKDIYLYPLQRGFREALCA
jgi:Druantia protein DruA